MRISYPRVNYAAWLAVAASLALTSNVVTAQLPATGQNSALRLSVESAKTSPTYGTAHASVGRQFAILSTRWENRIDPKIAADRGLATAYAVPDLAQHLILGIDGVFVGELQAKLDDGTGRKALHEISLAKPGAKTVGDVVYEIPDGPFKSLDLRFLDDTTGYISLALAGATPTPKPAFPLQKNQVLELGIWSFDETAKSPAPPVGFKTLTLDLRGRSTWTTSGEAPAYDVNASASTTRLNLLDWPDAWTYIHVIADGEYAYPPEESSSFAKAPHFVPEFFNGGRLVFYVPADAKSLSLLCEMPHAATPDGGTLDLPPMEFPLRGSAASGKESAPVVTINDEMFVVRIMSARKATNFAGEPAGEGKQFIVVQVQVKNGGAGGEFFVPHDQLLMLDADESEIAYNDVTARGLHRPEAQIHFPPGATRRFEVVYRIDRSITTPRLSFHGGNFQQSYELRLSP